MKSCLITLIFLAISWWMPTAVEARDLSKYPCTVFANGFCFRLTPDTAVSYSLPIDVEQYSVTEDGELLMAISVGGSKIRRSGGSATSKIELSGWEITGIKRDGASPIVIIMTNSRQRESAVEMSIYSTTRVNDEVRSVLSSMRPCKAIKSGGQKCPVDVEFGAALIEVVEELKGSGSPG